MSVRYLIDSNIIISGIKTYPRDVFPGYWDALEALQKAQRLHLCRAAFDEIDGRDDDASRWVHRIFPRASIINVQPTTTPHYVRAMQWAESRTPAFEESALREFARRTNADPWLVAHAREHAMTILTNETSSPRKIIKVKIPDAAEFLGVKCISLLDMLRVEKYVFSSVRN